ncbi:solute carrier family 28 member 3-like isoform X5 [Siniperca chuatsi]|uniref:solute carrier family 28 member 3-like isoform X5 n=1 Tax=Siniperca chuatsi TaxID=119488 RepID=UPI001CE20BBF|nr:solute carrier family 28 member 3-like isoform X5 [Siniperca chuatsi]
MNSKGMELTGIEKKSQKRGKDNKAFQSELARAENGGIPGILGRAQRPDPSDYTPGFSSRLRCHSHSGMCPELSPGCLAAGHHLGNRILPGLGLDDGMLWRPGVGGALSYQRPSQQKLVLDQMDNICVTVGGCGVLAGTGHSPARDQTDCVFLWFAALNLLNAVVLQTPIQVVLANFAMWDRATVCLWSADPQDQIWLRCTAVVWKTSRDVGSKFVFGASYTEHFFVFKIGFIMQVTMGTSPAESMAAAGNIFLGQTESPLLIRPFISGLTHSEIHAVMTGGFASISGTILGAFISFGVEATHLLTASVMSAPASLAIAKTFWPETETPRVTASHDFKMDQGESKNVLEAASQGASYAVALAANIVVNLVAFLALLAFFDAVLSWLGGTLDCPQLSFSLICSYVFMPLSFMMGVSWEDSFIVAELIGIKTFLNEFVAYQKLSELIKRRKAGGPEYVDNIKQYISVHSESIATYALCGFSNFASLGMLVGVLSTMAPDRRTEISSCGLRALIAGSVSCFMTACIAGMLYIPDVHCPNFLSTEFINTSVTSSSQLVTCCTQLYNSVTVYEPWNVTIGEGFSQRSLQRCCRLTPPSHFNCSLVL